MYRARVLASLTDREGRGLVKVLYLDHGWTALLPQSSLFRLDRVFCRVPQQVVTVPRTDLDQAQGLCWLDNTKEDARFVMAEEVEEINWGKPVGKREETKITKAFVTSFVLKLMIIKTRAQ